ncbi:hypothetical protein JK386_10230 [Nocardioides sp. zg-536]|uniref:DUF4352 domain-containing protein n=1 Tax=Nocardioides faecalis TaxID=2803858 RepID=A0A938YAI0_9ACTN|nr:hypothetical protein [Nocardioides faecalis]MBM9460279.1 hypothetical protein [Nocardioides faecalis]QVI59881.1 hypothetical protein KG111_06030 [Nocardioides faecalis]
MLTRLLVAGLGLVVLAGCGSGGGSAGDEESNAPSGASSAAPAYLEVPGDVDLTEPGTELAFGEDGVIAFERRQKEVGALSVTVQRLERTSFGESFAGWNVDEATSARTPYFVRLVVTNVGQTDLGGMLLDNVLWADDGSTLEAPNYYTRAQLPACTGGPLPTPFATGASAELCQVYFIAPARQLESVSFQPPAGLEAVTWRGEPGKVTKPGKKNKRDKKQDEKQDEKSQG